MDIRKDVQISVHVRRDLELITLRNRLWDTHNKLAKLHLVSREAYLEPRVQSLLN